MTIALTLLDPIAGIIAGAIGGGLLLAAYFLRLRRRPVRVSSTLLWRASATDLQVNVPLRWIRLSWLFFLQILILSCFALALARPAVEGGPSAGRLVILLIDCSASMSALDAAGPGRPPRSRLSAAKDRALEVLKRMSGGSEGMIVAFAARPTALTPMTRDAGRLRQAVHSLTPSDEPASPDNALELVRAMTGAAVSESTAAVPQVVIISDGGFAAPRAGSGAGRADVRFIRVGPPVYHESGAVFDNVGIVALSARRDFTDPATVRVFARIQSVVPRPIDVPVACTLDDRVLERRSVRLAAGNPDAPADSAVTFEFQSTGGGLVAVSLGRGDSLAADDAAALVLRPQRSARVVLVRPDGERTAADLLLEAALEALEPASFRVIPESAWIANPPEGLNADLVVFDRIRPGTLPAAPSISFGTSLPVSGLVVRYPQPESSPPPTDFVYWLRTHPVMRFVSLNGIWVDRAPEVLLPEESTPRTPTRVSATALASGETGPLIVLLEDRGIRRIVVPFDLARSNWIRDAGFHVFLKNAVEYLTLAGEADAGRALRTTDTLSVRLVPGAETVGVSGPLAFSRDVRGETPGGRVTLGPFPIAGVYRLSGVIAEDSLAAVNLLDPNESLIAARDSVEIGGTTVGGTSASSLGRREVWHWFVLAAVVLASIEWMLYARLMRV